MKHHQLGSADAANVIFVTVSCLGCAIHRPTPSLIPVETKRVTFLLWKRRSLRGGGLFSPTVFFEFCPAQPAVIRGHMRTNLKCATSSPFLFSEMMVVTYSDSVHSVRLVCNTETWRFSRHWTQAPRLQPLISWRFLYHCCQWHMGHDINPLYVPSALMHKDAMGAAVEDYFHYWLIC